MSLPVINFAAFTNPTSTQKERDETANLLGDACRSVGFFFLSNHGVPSDLLRSLKTESRNFFSMPLQEKLNLAMSQGGRAWRGYFPPGGELTSGKPDQKEGLYLGQELSNDHHLVKNGVPFHGQNLFPADGALKKTVLQYLDCLEKLGHDIMRAIALSLRLPEDYFRENFCGEPLCLFRIFNYPPPLVSDDQKNEQLWGVGEHTDYGMITILLQDEEFTALQVKDRTNTWIDVPPLKETFVINIGDMLEKMTRGLYRSTPHRVKASVGRDRLSWPYFFDPGYDAKIYPIELSDDLLKAAEIQRREDEMSGYRRWDDASLEDVDGTYGQYLISKVGKVFPDLKAELKT